MTANDQLMDLYQRVWPALQQVRAEHGATEGIQLVRLPDGWESVPLRVAIVGQETFGWTNKATAEEQVAYHPADGRLLSRSNTPFWSAVRFLMSRLTGDPATAFLWANLVPIDGGKRRAPEALRNAIREAVPAANGTTGGGLLPHVLAAAEPDVIIFLTGPSGYYRWEMEQQFPGIEEERVGDYGVREILRFRHDALPEATFRTYHPNYLRRTRRFDELLGRVADEALALVTPRTQSP